MIGSSNQIQSIPSIGEFLARTASGAGSRQAARLLRGSGARAALTNQQEMFSLALEKSLSEMGIAGDGVRVSVNSSPSVQSGGNRNLTQFIVTIANPAPGKGTDGHPEAAGDNPWPGPSISRDMWTRELLTDELPSSVLADVQDPAALLTARGERLNQPTDAKVTSAYDGNSQPINPRVLSTLDQAKQMQAKLEALGIDAGKIHEVVPTSGPFSINYGGDARRLYQIGPMNVGLLLHRYAENVKEIADARTLLDGRAASAA